LTSISPTTTIAIDQGEEKDIGPTPDLDTLKLKVTSHTLAHTPSHTQALSTQLSIADQEETKSQDHETKASSKKKEKEKKKPPSAKPPHTVLAAATAAASQPTCVTSAAISNSTSLTVDTSSARSLRSSMCQACRCVTNIDVMKASPNFPFKSQVPPGWSSPNICILCLIVFLTAHRRQRLAFEMAIQEKYSSCSHPHYKQWIAFANSEDDEELDANVARMFQVGKSLLSESYWMSRWTTEEQKKCRD